MALTKDQFLSFYSPEWIAMKVREVTHTVVDSCVNTALISLYYEFTGQGIENAEIEFNVHPNTLDRTDYIFILRSVYGFLRQVKHHFDFHPEIIDRIDDAIGLLYTTITRSDIRFLA